MSRAQRLAAIGAARCPGVSAHRDGAVGDLDVLEEATVHAQLVLAELDLVPDPLPRADTGEPRYLADHAARLRPAPLARVQHEDAVIRDGDDPVVVEREEE